MVLRTILLDVAILAGQIGEEPVTPAAGDDFTFGAVVWASIVAAVFALPLALSVWALLDVARRPRWAWALSGHRQVAWMTLVLVGLLSVVGGMFISAWYLWKVRPRIAAAEAGDF